MIKNRISIFIGHFGSGKSEVAVNYAIYSHKQGYKTMLADMDIINPFFRSAEAANVLVGLGIKVITPVHSLTNSDVPALPAEVYTVFADKSSHAVLDIGGDDLGARVLARYGDELALENCDVYMVINTKRSITGDADKILVMLDELQKASGMKIDYLVNNTNLLEETSFDMVMDGLTILKKVSEKSGIPISFSAMMKETVISEIDDCSDYLRMDKYIKLPF